MRIVPDSDGALQERKKNDPDSRFTYKAQRCHGHVKKGSPGVNPYAVCNASIGRTGAYRKKSRKD